MQSHCRLWTTNKTVCKVCMHTLLKGTQYARSALLTQKSALSLHKVCLVCMCSTQNLLTKLIPTVKLSGAIWRLVKMQTLCTNFADLCRLYADIMQKSIQVCSWHNFLYSYPNYAQNTLCRLTQTSCRHDADCHTIFMMHKGGQLQKFLSVLWFLQDLRDFEGMAPCWLLPGASTGREARRPRVVWLIRVTFTILSSKFTAARPPVRPPAPPLRWSETVRPARATACIKSAPNLQSVHLAHLVHTFHQYVETNAYFMQTLQTLCADFEPVHSVQTKGILRFSNKMQTKCTLQ